MCKSGCGGIAVKDKDRQRPLWMMSRPSGSLIHVSWAFTSSSSSSPGQVVQHFQRGSDYFLIAWGLRQGREWIA